jgi:N-acetyl-anhydromuramyl-L-alanine amidase AmpD
MFYLSTIIDNFVRKIIIIFCFTAICFCTKTIDAVDNTEKSKTYSVNQDSDFIGEEIKKANLNYHVTCWSKLGPVYIVIPDFNSPCCHIFDPSNENKVEPDDLIKNRETITDIIMHHTGCDLGQTLKIFSNGQNPFVNAHYIVTETGDIIQMVDPKYVARHAGISKFRGKEFYNLFSIGIEMVNAGFEINGASKNVNMTEIAKLTEYPKKQTESVFNLIKFLCGEYGIKDNIFAHGDVAPTRKWDPTSTFPWNELFSQEFGMGVSDDQIKEARQILGQKMCLRSECGKRCFDQTFYALLRCFGYTVLDNDVSKDINEYKNDVHNPVMAFLAHFSRNGQDIEQLREPLVFADLCHLYALCKKYPTGNNPNIDALIKSCE